MPQRINHPPTGTGETVHRPPVCFLTRCHRYKNSSDDRCRQPICEPLGSSVNRVRPDTDQLPFRPRFEFGPLLECENSFGPVHDRACTPKFMTSMRSGRIQPFLRISIVLGSELRLLVPSSRMHQPSVWVAIRFPSARSFLMRLSSSPCRALWQEFAECLSEINSSGSDPVEGSDSSSQWQYPFSRSAMRSLDRLFPTVPARSAPCSIRQ